MPKLINTKTRLAENLDPDAAHAAFLSGSHNLPSGAPVALVNPDNELVHVDPGEVYDAITKGKYQLAGDDRLEEARKEQLYGEGNSLKAFGEGAARGATFGGYDVAAPALGITSAEGIKERRERHPIASTAGDVVGTGLSLAIPGSPAGLVAKVGQATERAVAPLVARVGAKYIGKSIVDKAIPAAIGSAVEGLAYGARETVSEAALGDPDKAAENAMAQIGMSGLLAGGLGGVLAPILGPLEGKLAARIAKGEGKLAAESPAAQAGTRIADELTLNVTVPSNPASLRQSIDEMSVSENARKGILEGLSERKHNADEITKAAELLGAPVLESQVSASKHVQDIDSMLMQSPTPIGVARQQLLKDGIDKAETAVKSTLSDGTNQTLAEVGNNLKASLTDKLEKESAPIGALYAKLEQHGEIPVSKASTSQISKNIRNLEGVSVSPSSPEAQLANRVADELGNLKSVEDIRTYKKILNRSGSPETRYIRGRIAEKLNDLEEASIMRAAKNAQGTPEDKAQILQLLEFHDQAKAQYSEFRGKMEELGAVLGKKKIYGKTDFLDFIDDLAPEKIATRLFAKKDSEFLKFFSKNFPEETQNLLRFQRSQIMDNATKDGVVNVNAVLREVDKLSPEVRSILFKPEDFEKLEAAKTYMESLPKNINPSGTSKSEAYRRFFSNPISATAETARDYVAQATLNRIIDTTGGQDAAGIKTLIQLERMANKTLLTIEKGTKKAFENRDSYAGFIGSQLAKPKKEEDRKEDAAEPYKTYRANVGRIAQLSGNPLGLLDKMEEVTQPIYPHAPNITAGFHQAVSAGVSFLASKVPQPPQPPKPLSPEWIPGATEVARFNRYYDTVEKPLSVLGHIADGTLTRENVEAITQVYPQLYSQMKNKFLERITDTNRKVPYQLKLMLTLFFGQDMDDSMESQSIMQNQKIIAGNAAQQQQKQNKAVRPSQAGLGKLDMASRSMTAQQTSSGRSG